MEENNIAATTIDYPRGLTFEKVWAMFQETARQMEETDRKIQENARQMEETDRRFKKTERFIKSLSRQMGGLHNSFGELAEHLVAPGIAERFNELGYHFDTIATRGAKIYGEKGKVIAEIDILLENGDFIIAVEVKADPKVRDVERHLKRLELLRERKKPDKRKIRGAIAGAIYDSETREATIDAGLYLLEQSGDTMKMELPDGFVPREW